MTDCGKEGKVHSIHQSHCKTCSLSSLCLPVSLNMTEMDRLDDIIEKSRPLKKGDHLFHQGDAFKSVYAIRAGSVKTYTITDQGEEQITGFYFPGELVGLSGYDDGIYPISVKMLETTAVCEIPFDNLDDLCGQLPELRRQVMRTMSKEIKDDQQMMLLLSKKNAEARIATFILKLSQRFKARGYSEHKFRLSMSRNEIGNYLGLAVETVSRIFTRFQKSEILAVDGKEIELLSIDKLYEISGECPGTSEPTDTQELSI
ncbi:fumarate/nitrate reduction transcriptional regulator Fnr [Neptunomonas phycophila]|jgi:CRP/FNR family transcriptional regulator|uniref:Fumarate/nitrate reduction transcriptional regulator Fnr n=1 Tax=Neptunomonas phycophila TaxID=1572645 RepID=A0AAW7XCJ3_9GAMM|nr:MULTISPECIES: fumarate/nitrate reduction transcriptional regulator Fnr [Neptunomonas]MBT3146240.1 fumarate/nitrate reduction transcriptional regulator Fnr [Neptunomonas phycophila]MDN2659584.1 fumarate/nitrate reduction transcriptional regulator Fnr [Neptunomonas sp. CHC150]MDO6452126.1 fumarate/nitrate reduction transcriptional regulator Fnr [Neptunomonas phycophila]MDO6466679.1 fumarate/nitrate reduction transcriptional regulator Fnr [Neptunomonas phycophila]MDO6783091.1 fumarate/nitrate 